MEKFRGWVRARPVLWIVGVFFVALVIGSAITASEKSGLEDDKSQLEDQLAGARSERTEALEDAEQAEADAEAIEDERAEIVADAKAQAGKIVGGARAEARQLENVRSEMENAQQELASVEGEIGGAEEEAALSFIPGNGTYKAEADFIPGTYRSSGGSNCYWATLNSADPWDIASNENGSGPQIATIESPYFQTKGCGEWERIE